jgi:hypothetical protein
MAPLAANVKAWLRPSTQVDGDLAAFSEIEFGTGDHGFTKLENRGGP